jgi:hypothetical protein
MIPSREVGGTSELQCGEEFRAREHDGETPKLRGADKQIVGGDRRGCMPHAHALLRVGCERPQPDCSAEASNELPPPHEHLPRKRTLLSTAVKHERVSLRHPRTCGYPYRGPDASPQQNCSLDHLVGAGEERGRDRKAQGFGRSKIDEQFKFRRTLSRQVGRIRTLEDFSTKVAARE